MTLPTFAIFLTGGALFSIASYWRSRLPIPALYVQLLGTLLLLLAAWREHWLHI